MVLITNQLEIFTEHFHVHTTTTDEWRRGPKNKNIDHVLHMPMDLL